MAKGNPPLLFVKYYFLGSIFECAQNDLISYHTSDPWQQRLSCKHTVANLGDVWIRFALPIFTSDKDCLRDFGFIPLYFSLVVTWPHIRFIIL